MLKKENGLNGEIKLELGKFLEQDMLELSDGDEANGGTTPAITIGASAISAFVSQHTCPTTACTRAC